MKYIRTKEGIWEVMEIKPQHEKVYYHCKHNLIGKRFEEKEIIKQADTIAELCDEFVCWYDEYKLPVSLLMTEKEKYEQMKKVILLAMKNNIDAWLKLAIWTDKGLIYVAKMNEKGDLELL